jgi:Family of unknown function (DUF6523)
MMTNSRGFGKEKPQPKISKRSEERAKASKQFDTMKSDGVPEFEVYMRTKNSKNWFPVGAIAVKRTSLIHNAIYDNEAQLLQGAFRAFPILQKNRDNLEYGYRLKEFKDEPIQVAVKPEAKVAGAIQGAIGKISSLFQRK